MVFNLFKKKDPICGMKQEKGKGFIDEKSSNWFCSIKCKDKYYDNMENTSKTKSGCCH